MQNKALPLAHHALFVILLIVIAHTGNVALSVFGADDDALDNKLLMDEQSPQACAANYHNLLATNDRIASLQQELTWQQFRAELLLQELDKNPAYKTNSSLLEFALQDRSLALKTFNNCTKSQSD